MDMKFAAPPILAAKLLDASADPLVFEFQRPTPPTGCTRVSISRTGWSSMSPSQAIGYVVDRYLLEQPMEAQRVGRDFVINCVNLALGIPVSQPLGRAA